MGERELEVVHRKDDGSEIFLDEDPRQPVIHVADLATAPRGTIWSCRDLLVRAPRPDPRHSGRWPGVGLAVRSGLPAGTSLRNRIDRGHPVCAFAFGFAPSLPDSCGRHSEAQGGAAWIW